MLFGMRAMLSTVALIFMAAHAVNAQAQGCSSIKPPCPGAYIKRSGTTFLPIDGLAQPIPALPSVVGFNYTDDVSCCEKRPILCINKSKFWISPIPWFPLPTPQPSTTTPFENHWSGGFIGATCPYYGWQLTSRVVADKYCFLAFGLGWRMAEFTDGSPTNGFNPLYGRSFFGYQAPEPSGVQYRTRHWTAMFKGKNCWL